ncbi:MAG: HD domain-containing protein [Nitrospirota bacterium]|nr:HD domain-containing protein [Nitrospirota bacterium]
MQSEPNRFLTQIARLAQGPVYLVGGTVRDLLLDSRTIKDNDLIMPAGSDQVARAFAASTGGSFFYLDEERHISRVMITDEALSLQFDFADFEGKDLEADLGRRDFTMNAMALDLRDFLERRSLENTIDLFGGRADIEQRLIRVVAPSVLDDDPLRVLRAVRFAATLDFDIEDKTRDEITARAGSITMPSPERLRDELFLILSASDVERSLRLIESLGILEPLFPELSSLRGFAPGRYHQHDILAHSFKTAGYADRALDDLAGLAGDGASRIRDHLQEPLEQGITRMAALRFACLLHDVAKGETYSREPDGDVHFHGHEQLGADRARAVCERFRLSRAVTVVVERLIRHHMRPLQLSQGNGPSKRALYRYCRDLKEALPESVVLALADGRATSEAMTLEGFRDTGSTAVAIMEYYYDKFLKAKDMPLVTGQDLISLGLRPGPVFRELLDMVREQQAEGMVRDRQAALDLVRRRIDGIGPSN